MKKTFHLFIYHTNNYKCNEKKWAVNCTEWIINGSEVDEYVGKCLIIYVGHMIFSSCQTFV